jgi:hypothetical protein
MILPTFGMTSEIILMFSRKLCARAGLRQIDTVRAINKRNVVFVLLLQEPLGAASRPQASNARTGA